MKTQSKGFSLLEMVVAAAIVAGLTTWTVPRYIRALRQAEVDRYSQAIEAGLFNLRAELGTSRTSCQLKFDQTRTWVTPQELLEFRQDNGQLADTGRLRCCNSQIEKANKLENRDDECHDGPLIGALLNRSTASDKGSMRFIRLEGSNTSKQVEVAVSRSDYELTPPGTSIANECELTPPGTSLTELTPLGTSIANECPLTSQGSSSPTEPLTFMVRSIDTDGDSKLVSRCLQISGNGHLMSGTWEGSLSTGQCKAKAE